MPRIIALDYGEKRIGVAVSDPLQITAQAVGVVHRGENLEQDIAELKRLISRYEGIGEIVVGLPKTLKGELGPQAQKTLEFVAVLQKSFNLSINTLDERFTTVTAERALLETGMSRAKRKKVIDQSAAAVLLQDYLNSKSR